MFGAKDFLEIRDEVVRQKVPSALLPTSGCRI